jgi:hypothetical protein
MRRDLKMADIIASSCSLAARINGQFLTDSPSCCRIAERRGARTQSRPRCNRRNQQVDFRREESAESCEHCHPDDAEIPFDWILAEVMNKRGPYEFILSESARCPKQAPHYGEDAG